MTFQNSFQKWLPALFGLILVALIGVGLAFWMKPETSPSEQAVLPASSPSVSASVSPAVSPSTGVSGMPESSPSVGPSPSAVVSATPLPPGKVDLTVDSNGMSKSTVVVNTTQGVIKFKLYSQDAPNTVNRFVELVQKGFYNGLTFHRAIDGFIIQTGDPTGSGTGGSGQRLKAEFNSRHHIEGAVAMARAPQDPDSADSQFYITLSTQPRLDRNYTVFGQVIDGMDVVRKIKVGDKINSMTME